MAAVIKTKAEIASMRKGGRLLAEILSDIVAEVKPGITTEDLDNRARALCKKHSVKPAFYGYFDYPAYICVGIDDVAIHGMPSKSDVLVEGQIISIDMGIIFEDLYLDHATTVAVGSIDSKAERFLSSSKLALQAGIKNAKVGGFVGDISNAIETVASMSGYSVITEMTGHGVGRSLHEDPSIPCFGKKGTGEMLKEGMTLAIEAMINEGDSELIHLDDGWTTLTVDGKRSALYEHTVLISKKGPEILTIR